MKKTSRRNLLKIAALGGGSAALGLAVKQGTSEGEVLATALQGQGHSHKPVSGPLATATVSFGSWQTDPPADFDRFVVPNPAPPATHNHHALVPYEVTIQAGGTVNFIISGFHLIAIYDDGTRPEDINPNILTAGTTPPGFIADTNHRIYRGVDPRTVSQDRIEAVNFPKAGTYLVICAVRPHFVNDGMFGYVRVLP
jgi:plastocyanin